MIISLTQKEERGEYIYIYNGKKEGHSQKKQFRKKKKRNPFYIPNGEEGTRECRHVHARGGGEERVSPLLRKDGFPKR